MRQKLVSAEHLRERADPLVPAVRVVAARISSRARVHMSPSSQAAYLQIRRGRQAHAGRSAARDQPVVGRLQRRAGQPVLERARHQPGGALLGYDIKRRSVRARYRQARSTDPSAAPCRPTSACSSSSATSTGRCSAARCAATAPVPTTSSSTPRGCGERAIADGTGDQRNRVGGALIKGLLHQSGGSSADCPVACAATVAGCWWNAKLSCVPNTTWAVNPKGWHA